MIVLILLAIVTAWLAGWPFAVKALWHFWGKNKYARLEKNYNETQLYNEKMHKRYIDSGHRDAYYPYSFRHALHPEHAKASVRHCAAVWPIILMGALILLPVWFLGHIFINFIDYVIRMLESPADKITDLIIKTWNGIQKFMWGQ
jgi:hypothetical protein